MAKNKKTGGRNILPGRTGNPNGRPKLPPEVKAIRYCSKETVAKLYWDVVNMNRQEVERRLADPTLSLFERNVLAAIVKDISKGVITTIEKLMERVLGKPKEVIHLDGVINQGNAVDLSKLTNEEIMTLMTLVKRGRVDVGDSSNP